MRLDTSNLSPSVTRALRDFYRRRRICAFARFLLGGIILGSVLALAAMHADRFLFLSQQLRTRMLLLVGAATVVYIVTGLAAFFLGRSRARDVAYDLENQLPPDCQERLVAAESLSREMAAEATPVQKQLAENLREYAETYARKLRSASLAKDQKLRHRAIGILFIAALCAALFAAPGYQFGLMTQRFFRPSANLPKPSFVSIQVEPETIQVGTGGETVIRANVSGQVPAWMQWLYRKLDIRARQCLIASQDGEYDRLEFGAENTDPMTRVRKDLFIVSRTDLQQSFSFQIRYADAQTKVRFAEVVPHPEIRKLRIRVQPPEYTELPEQTYDEVGDALRLYPESEVTVQFWVDQAVPKRSIEIDGRDPVEPAWDKEERKGTWSFVFERDLEADIQVENAKGFPNKRGGKLTFAVREDQGPAVELESPRGTISLVPGELLPVRGVLADDLKIKEAVLSYILNPDTNSTARPRTSTIKIDPDNQGEVEFVTLFDLQETGLAPGDVLRFHIRARDSGGNDGESQTVTIHAQSFARGANEQRRIEVLDFIDQALPVMVRAREQELSENQIRNDLAELAAACDEIESAPTSMDALLELLEREHHFSDAPADKAGTRRLAFLLAAAGTDSASINELRTRMLTPWRRYRRHRNLTWRYFGMRREAMELAEKIRVMVKKHNQYLRRVRDTLVKSVARTMERIDEDAQVQQSIRAMEQARKRLQSVNKKIRDSAQAGANNNMGGMGGDPVVVTDDQEQNNELFKERQEIQEAMNEARSAVMNAALTTAREWIGNQEYGEEAANALSSGELRTFLGSAVQNVLDKRRSGDDTPTRNIARQALNKVLTAEKTEEGAVSRRLRRRAAVFFDILQDTGGEMLDLAAESSFLDGETISDLQQDINVGARQISSGDSAAAERHCRETARNLGSLLQDHLIRTLPKAARQSDDALAQLEREYHRHVQRLFSSSDDWAREALARDGRMLQLAPFALSPREAARNLILRDRISDARDRQKLLDESVMNSRLVAAEASREALVLRNAGLKRWGQWRETYLAGLEKLSADEHYIANALRALELGMRTGEQSTAIADLANYLSTFEFDAEEPPTAEFANFANTDESVAPLAASLLKELSSVAAEEPVIQLAERLAEDAARVREAQRTIQSGADAETAVEIFAEIASRLKIRSQQYTNIIDMLRLQIAYDDNADIGKEVLYLALRENYSGWQGRGMTIVERIEDAGDQNAEEMDAAALFPLLSRLMGQLQALADNVRSTGEEYMENRFTAERGRQLYADFAIFETSRGYLEASRRMLAAENPRKVAEEYLAQSKELSLRFIAMNRKHIVAVAEAVDKVRDTLSDEIAAGALNGDSLRSSLQYARTSLEKFVEGVNKTASFPVRDEILEQARALQERLRVFELPPEAVREGVARNRKIFALAELFGDVESLLRKVDDTRVAAQTSQTLFSGGPSGIREARLWRSNEHRTARLGAIHEQSTIAVGEGMLEALEAQTAHAMLLRAYDWAFISSAMVRSPLTGDVVSKPPDPEDESQTETLKSWLLAQIEEGRKELRAARRMGPYERVTDEFFGAFSDFVRY